MTYDLTCRIFTGRTQVAAVAPTVEAMRRTYGLDADMTTDMAWFVSRTLLWGNSPIVVLVNQGAKPVAAVLLYQRRYCGIPTGVIKGGNGSGDGVVVAPLPLRMAALQVALAKVLLLPLTHTVLVAARGVNAQPVSVRPQLDLERASERQPAAVLDLDVAHVRVATKSLRDIRLGSTTESAPRGSELEHHRATQGVDLGAQGFAGHDEC